MIREKNLKQMNFQQIITLSRMSGIGERIFVMKFVF